MRRNDGIDNKQLLAAAKRLPCFGILRRSAAGFIYLEISQGFGKLSSYLAEQNLTLPPDMDHVGLHVSVILADESQQVDIGLFPEAGKIIYFVPTRLCTVTMECGESKYQEWHNIHVVWLLEIYCPLIEKLRMRYGLPAKIKDHEFHITFTVQEF